MLLSDALMKYETLNKEQIDYIVDNGTIPSEKVFEETSDESKIKTIDELKEKATYVTDDFDQEGIIKALYHEGVLHECTCTKK